VEWADGPTPAAVEAILDQFEGAGFDGMIDLQTYNQHWLTPDGRVSWAEVGIGHSFPGEHRHYPAPHPDAELVSFGADYVFAHRRYSVSFLSRVAGEVCKARGWKPPEVLDSDCGAYVRCGNYERERAIWQAAEATACDD